ncbi:MAG: hypothetical protein MK168_05420, partial [Candidatus Thalassarchaeum sp.]|nr:hypothetical protein [Candidatus Thalassarchaeum sp.]
MKLWEYVVRRIILLIPVLIGVSILTFSISHLVPADPARSFCGLKCPDETLEQIKLNLHFTDEDGEPESVWNQYKWYMGLTDEDGDGNIFFDKDTNLGSASQGSAFFGMDFDSGGLIDGNWGYSLAYHKPVTQVLEQAVPVTLEMSFGARRVGAPIGIFLGVLSAVYQD